MKRLSFAFGTLLTVVAVALFVSMATGQGHQSLKARLSGFQEVPSVSTSGSGDFRAKISADGTSVDYTLSYQNLEAATLFAHIHLSARGVNGGVMAFLCGGGGKPACTSNVGLNTVSGTIVAADIIGPAGQGIAAGEFTEFLRALRSGNTYANVHSTMFPGGEIRGQISTDDEDN